MMQTPSVSCNLVGFMSDINLICSVWIPTPPWSGAGLERVVQFLRWLTGCIEASLYPGAPHARQQAALELMTTLLDVWDDRVSVAQTKTQVSVHACACSTGGIM